MVLVELVYGGRCWVVVELLYGGRVASTAVVFVVLYCGRAEVAEVVVSVVVVTNGGRFVVVVTSTTTSVVGCEVVL
jgi:hypothetical protein